jgi:hypothetical protein
MWRSGRLEPSAFYQSKVCLAPFESKSFFGSRHGRSVAVHRVATLERKGVGILLATSTIEIFTEILRATAR